MSMKRKILSSDEALVKLETLCMRSEQSQADCLEKMRRWGVDINEARKVMNSLVERRFVDDERFARAYTADKIRFNRWGRRKVKMMLSAKRISPEIISSAMSVVDEEEYEQLLVDLLRSKVISAGIECSFEGRTKLFRFGATRGFETELVSRIIKSGKPWMRQDGEE